MQARLAYLLLACLCFSGLLRAQYLGGAGNGDVRVNLASGIPCMAYYSGVADGHATATRTNPDPCNYFDGGLADGSARIFLPNPDPCDYFDGSQKDGAAMATFSNPDTCGQFEGGRADGNGRSTLLSPVPCIAFFSSQRDGAAKGYLTCTPLTVVASELFGRTEEQDGYLWWYTFSEINNLGFILERSTDQLAWTEIGFAAGQTSSNARRKYEMWDREMVPGVNYYRWQQYDLDGARSLSNIVALVKAEPATSSLSVYPNPVGENGLLQVHFQDVQEQLIRIQVVDIYGHILYNLESPAAPSPRHFEIATEEYSAGIYFLVLSSATEQITRRFMVR